jgi:hypothetical protein
MYPVVIVAQNSDVTERRREVECADPAGPVVVHTSGDSTVRCEELAYCREAVEKPSAKRG